MQIFEINIQEPYFSHILSGKKTVEGRLNKGKFLEMQVGDILKINNNTEFIISEKNIYKSFKEMIESEGRENVIPDALNTDEAVSVYRKFYSAEDELKYGVVAIGMKKWSEME